MPLHRLPLTTLLSQALVAYTIEFDNEFERRMPHRITEGPRVDAPRGPWLVSLVMWSNFLSSIPEEGISVRDLYYRTGLEKALLKQRLTRLSRGWGYLTFLPPPGGDKSSPPADWIVLPRPTAQKAWQIWPSLFQEIEDRWSERYGREVTRDLRASLSAMLTHSDAILPEALPILNAVWAGWFAELPAPPRINTGAEAAAPSLSALLARTLLILTLDFERKSDMSLAIGANLIRVLNDTGVRLADLPRLTGVSKEAIKMTLGFLSKYRFVVIENDPAAARTKQVRLTAKGIEAKHAFARNLKAAEKRWQKTYGAETIQSLRQSLEAIAPRLHESLESNPEGWRAKRPKPETLPHHPLILHRGGFPDGA